MSTSNNEKMKPVSHVGGVKPATTSATTSSTTTQTKPVQSDTKVVDEKIFLPHKSSITENDACAKGECSGGSGGGGDDGSGSGGGGGDNGGDNGGGDNGHRFELKAYFAEWSPYNVQEPTGFPGSINKVPTDEGKVKYNENTSKLAEKLKHVDSVVYSFAEIKQNSEPGVVNENMTATATSYTDNPDYVGKLYIFDAWSALQASDIPWFTANNDLISDGYIDFLIGAGRDPTNPDDPDLKYDFGYGNLSALANYNETQLTKILGIGGYGDVYQLGWEAATQSSDTLQRFADSVKNILTNFKLDGVDLDWEPLSLISENNLQNSFVWMTQVLRDTLGDDKKIGFPISVDTKQIEAFGAENWKSLAEYVDEIGLMAYDMHGAFDGATDATKKVTGLQSMTYPVSCDDSGFSTDAAVKKLIEFGVPAEKISVGYPSYGRGLQGVCEAKLGVPFEQHDSGANLDPSTGISSYTWLMNKLDTDPNAVEYTVTVNQDGKDVANGAYMYFNNDVFYSYDNVESVSARANYVVENNLKGMLTWLIENDLPVSDDRSLVKVVSEILHNAGESSYNPVRYHKLLPDANAHDVCSSHCVQTKHHVEGLVA